MPFINANTFAPLINSQTCTIIMHSKNPLNTRLGHVGTKFGEAHRSQIFITALTFSISAWILLATAVFTLSTSPSLVSSVPFFQGTISMTNATTKVVSELNYYGGLNAVVVEDCTSANTCPPHVQAWPSVDCGTHFENCDQCRDSISDLVVPTIMAFLTQVLQILGDVQRSTGMYCSCLILVITAESCTAY